MSDRHHLLPRHRPPTELEQRQAAILERELNRVIAERQDNGVRDPVDAVRLRGIPAVGRGGAGGHIAGTRPDYEVLKLDRKRRVRSRRKL